MTDVPVGLIIFDCDGVLVDSEPLATRILVQTLAEFGMEIDVADAYEAFLGKSLATVCDQLRDDYQVDVDAAALERMRERLHQAIRQELRPIPGIEQALRQLGRRCCVASSSQVERINLSLEVTGLSSFFDGRLFSASMVSRGKPAPDLFLHAAREMQVDPLDCVVVEDSPAGIAAARNAGMEVLGFIGGSHARSVAHLEKLEALGARRVFEDMRELPSLVRALETQPRVT